MSIASSPASPLVSAFADDAAKQRRANAKRYMELLLAAAEAGDAALVAGVPAPVPDPKTVAQLRTLAAALSKSPAEVEADTRVMESVAGHRRRIAGGQGMGEPRDAAMAAVVAYREETERLRAARHAEQVRLMAAYEALRYKCRDASRAVNDIGDLCSAHPELLRDLERPARES